MLPIRLGQRHQEEQGFTFNNWEHGLEEPRLINIHETVVFPLLIKLRVKGQQLRVRQTLMV